MDVVGSLGPPARRRQLRRYALYGSAAMLAGALAYGAYRSDAVAQTRRSLARLRLALQRYSEALSSGADLCSTLVRDLQSFLQSDATEVPGSLRQLARLLQSREVAATTSSTVAAVYRGLAGEPAGGAAPSSAGGPGALDKVLEALLSDRGHSLVSVAVGMGARNMVGAFVEASARVSAQQGQQPPVVDKILDFVATERGQQLAVAAITAFVTNGVRVYMDATLGINFYEDIFASMARPAHLEAVKQCIGMFAREAVGTAMQGGSPPRQPTPGRATLIQELSPPPSPRSPTGTPRQQQQQPPGECPDFRGSPLDSAYNGDSPSPAPSLSEAPAGSADALSDEASSRAVAPLRLPPRAQQQQQQQGAGDAFAADDRDSDSLLHARRDACTKEAAAAAKQQQQLEPPGGANLAWLPAVTREVLTVVKDPNARSVLVGAAGATARELGAAAVTGLGQLEVTRRWGTRGLIALLLLSFLTVCLVQELLRAAVLAVLT